MGEIVMTKITSLVVPGTVATVVGTRLKQPTAKSAPASIVLKRHVLGQKRAVYLSTRVMATATMITMFAVVAGMAATAVAKLKKLTANSASVWTRISRSPSEVLLNTKAMAPVTMKTITKTAIMMAATAA